MERLLAQVFVPSWPARAQDRDKWRKLPRRSRDAALHSAGRDPQSAYILRRRQLAMGSNRECCLWLLVTEGAACAAMKRPARRRNGNTVLVVTHGAAGVSATWYICKAWRSQPLVAWRGLLAKLPRSSPRRTVPNVGQACARVVGNRAGQRQSESAGARARDSMVCPQRYRLSKRAFTQKPPLFGTPLLIAVLMAPSFGDLREAPGPDPSAGHRGLDFRIHHTKLSMFGQCLSKPDQVGPMSCRTERSDLDGKWTSMRSLMWGLRKSKSRWHSAARRGGSGPGSFIEFPTEWLSRGLSKEGS